MQRTRFFRPFIKTSQGFVNQHRLLIVFMRYSYMFLSVLMLSRFNYLESNYILPMFSVVGFLTATFEE